MDETLAWATPLWEKNDPAVSSLFAFLNIFRQMFEVLGRSSSTASALLRLCKGTSTLCQYALHFRNLTAELSWNNEALVAAFYQGLPGGIKDELAGRSIPSGLDALVTLCNQIDIHFQERSLERSQSCSILMAPTGPLFSPKQAPTSLASPAPEEPMQLDRVRLPPPSRLIMPCFLLYFYSTCDPFDTNCLLKKSSDETCQDEHPCFLSLKLRYVLYTRKKGRVFCVCANADHIPSK